jgi:hypothetical protein
MLPLVRRFAVMLAVAVLAALGSFEPASAGDAQPPSASDAQRRLCRNTFGGDLIRVRIVRCPRARFVVRTWAHRFRRDGRATRRVFRFRCRGRIVRFEGLTVACRRVGGRATIRFYVNVPR